MSGHFPVDPHLDPQFVDKVVQEVKSQGVFDEFRKDFMSDVDTKPAYQNLRLKVQNTTKSFLEGINWTPDLNKQQLREKLRQHIINSSYLDIGLQRLVDQVVNPKTATVIQPRVEEIAYKVAGIPIPEHRPEPPKPMIHTLPPLPPYNCETLKIETVSSLLPTDLEQISPDSDQATNKSNDKESSFAEEKACDEDDESPPFEPLVRSIFSPEPTIRGIDDMDTSDSTALPPPTATVIAVEGSTCINSSINDIETLSSSEIVEKEASCSFDATVASQESQLSQVSINSRISAQSPREFREYSAPNNANVNISEEAQMPKFNENSSEASRLQKPAAELHFDIKKDEIVFEGTDRKSNLLKLQDSVESISNGAKEQLEKKEKSAALNSSFQTDSNQTANAAESSFGSSLEDTSSTAQLNAMLKSKADETIKTPITATIVSQSKEIITSAKRSPSSSTQSSTRHKKHHHHSKDRHGDSSRNYSRDKDRSSSNSRRSKERSKDRHSHKDKLNSNSSSRSESAGHSRKAHARSDSAKKSHHHASSKSSSSTTSKKDKRKSSKHAHDDHSESREKIKRRKSNDSNDDHKKRDGSGGGGGAGFAAGKREKNGTSSAAKHDKRNFNDGNVTGNAGSSNGTAKQEQLKAAAMCIDGALQNEDAAKKPTYGNVVLLNDALNNANTDFIEFEMHENRVQVVLSQASNTKSQTDEVSTTAVQTVEAVPQTTMPELSPVHNDAIAVEEPEFKALANSTQVVSSQDSNTKLDSTVTEAQTAEVLTATNETAVKITEPATAQTTVNNINNDASEFKELANSEQAEQVDSKSEIVTEAQTAKVAAPAIALSSPRPVKDNLSNDSDSGGEEVTHLESKSLAAQCKRLDELFKYTLSGVQEIRNKLAVTAVENVDKQVQQQANIKEDVDKQVQQQHATTISKDINIQAPIQEINDLERASKISPVPSESSLNSKENEIFDKNAINNTNKKKKQQQLQQRRSNTPTPINKLSSQQRYKSEDLYKPRPVLSQRPRRRDWTAEL